MVLLSLGEVAVVCDVEGPGVGEVVPWSVFWSVGAKSSGLGGGLPWSLVSPVSVTMDGEGDLELPGDAWPQGISSSCTEVSILSSSRSIVSSTGSGFGEEQETLSESSSMSARKASLA